MFYIRMLIRGGVISFCLLLTNTIFSNPLWHCTAKNDSGAEWYWYADDKNHARAGAEKQCVLNNQKKPCEVICIPPRDYWRCVSHDIINKNNVKKDKNNKEIQQHQGSWYWTSYSKTVAINGARDACRHNSQNGGCYANSDACALS